MTPLRRHPDLRKRLPRLLLAVLLACAWTLPATAQDEAPVERLRTLAASDRDAALARLNERLATPADDTDAARLERAQLHELRGRILRGESRYDAARADADAMLALAEGLDDPVLQSRAVRLAGTLQAERGRLVAALESFQRADALLPEAGVSGERVRVRIALGNVHLFTDNAERAATYFDEARALARRVGNEQLEISALANKAVALSRTRGPAAALDAHREALDLARRAGEPLGLHNANICDRLVELERAGEAGAYCRDALDQLSRAGANRHLAGARMTMGDVLMARDRPRAALAFYRAANDLAAERIPSVERELLRGMARANRALGRFEAAADRLDELLSLRADLERTERDELLQELDARYRVREMERENELLELQSDLDRAQLARRNQALLGIGTSLVVVSVLALFVLRAYRKQRDYRRELSKRNEELEAALETIGRMAREDALTGLMTRIVFLEAAEQEIARMERNGKPSSVVMIDIDHFKRINDTHGHAVGDEVLVEVAARLRAGLRRMDYVCRWGGEEFICLLPGANVDTAAEIMARLKDRFTDEAIETEVGTFEITLTFGIAPFADDMDASIKAADLAMYRGKRAGRNRIEQTGNGSTDADRRSN